MHHVCFLAKVVRARLALIQQRRRRAVGRRCYGAASVRTPDDLGREVIDRHARAGPETNGAASVAVGRNKPPPNAAVKRRSHKRPISAHSSRFAPIVTDATAQTELYQ